jgi:D-alanyl-D-alanine carboxypeptidase
LETAGTQDRKAIARYSGDRDLGANQLVRVVDNVMHTVATAGSLAMVLEEHYAASDDHNQQEKHNGFHACFLRDQERSSRLK